MAGDVGPTAEAPRDAAAQGPQEPAQRVRARQEGAGSAGGYAHKDRGTQEGSQAGQASQGTGQVAQRDGPVLDVELKQRQELKEIQPVATYTSHALSFAPCQMDELTIAACMIGSWQIQNNRDVVLTVRLDILLGAVKKKLPAIY
ncbi:hypothetical protein F441_15911 [Phytophthora nicotianae CJ01A1]|uniref:Uncharacterized protein n=5 Tax=Phytophthora nicotianae TaxID=4792 RepID=V9EHQ6_PHYNI|nr:hypothetical protein F443_16082 [Phytophthora nicotianae P1569]ETK78286.1 hypothetical protein L915_15626 [Phytophthora nicotianae]ETO66837.1 hypothetical protein F444_16066 [Phytophthora nicotianae P1976]ETP07953.1 hypothetical protein F441_15911 [Phytophthora nicotianae CJ01A1]ETP35996.1 hypothetical protein F442_15932 [Phytophthora nicotianae P10297]